jgi:hypothetical protein
VPSDGAGHDRATPIKGVHTEGVGWPADVLVPYGPVVRAKDDPVREIGLTVLAFLDAGAKTDKVRDAFGGLFAGRMAEFAKAEPYGADPKVLARLKATSSLVDVRKLVEDDLKKRLESELALLRLDDVGPRDVLGARARLAALEPQATAAGMKSALADLQSAVKKLATEGAAQEAFLAMTDRAFGASDADKKKFLSTYKDSQIAKFAKERFWK